MLYFREEILWKKYRTKNWHKSKNAGNIFTCVSILISTHKKNGIHTTCISKHSGFFFFKISLSSIHPYLKSITHAWFGHKNTVNTHLKKGIQIAPLSTRQGTYYATCTDHWSHFTDKPAVRTESEVILRFLKNTCLNLPILISPI